MGSPLSLRLGQTACEVAALSFVDGEVQCFTVAGSRSRVLAETAQQVGAGGRQEVVAG
jgi:hypothetical protein